MLCISTKFVFFDKLISDNIHKLCYNITVFIVNAYVVIPLTHHQNSGYTGLRVLGVWRSSILLFTAFLVGVLKG